MRFAFEVRSEIRQGCWPFGELRGMGLVSSHMNKRGNEFDGVSPNWSCEFWNENMSEV